MIQRYSRPAMVAIWQPEARFKIWFEIEAHATEALAKLGVVPQSAADALWRWWATKPASGFRAKRISGKSTPPPRK